MTFRFWVSKKIIPLFFLIGLAINCAAQKPRFDVFAGPQISTVKYSVDGVKQSVDHKYGFQAGFGMKIPFETNLFFSPAAMYSLKGYKVKFNRYANPPDSLATDNSTTIHTFELAFLLQFDMGSNPRHFFLKAGPSLDFQLKGREKFHLKDGSLVNRNMVYDFAVYGRYGVNMLVQLGFETEGFSVFGQYSLGLTNINNADNGPNIRYRIYNISFGKYLGSRSKVPANSSK